MLRVVRVCACWPLCGPHEPPVSLDGSLEARDPALGADEGHCRVGVAAEDQHLPVGLRGELLVEIVRVEQLRVARVVNVPDLDTTGATGS